MGDMGGLVGLGTLAPGFDGAQADTLRSGRKLSRRKHGI
jgi:hypothetical protein